jgi:hypothetical protein
MIQNEFAYNTVVALNNAGVILVQRRLYSGAMETFKDALRLMRHSFFSQGDDVGSGSGGGSDTISPQYSDYNAALQAAWQRTSVVVAPGQDCHEHDTNLPNILVVSDHDNPYAVYDALDETMTTSANSTFCCVTIDPIDCFTDCDEMAARLETESAIILYNYGMVYRCLAEGNDATTASVHDYFRTSFHIVELAHSVTAKLLHEATSSTHDHPMDVPSNVLLIALLVADSLLQMSATYVMLQDDGKVQQHRRQNYQYADDLDDILATISEREMFLLHEGAQLSAAPAA